MENTVKQRLKKFIKSKGISERQFCLQIGASPAFVANIVQSIQPNRVNSIANQFPDLNTGWLLTGEGEMLKNSIQDISTDRQEVTLVPLLPVSAQGGRLNDFVVSVRKEDAKS